MYDVERLVALLIYLWFCVRLSSQTELRRTYTTTKLHRGTDLTLLAKWISIILIYTSRAPLIATVTER